MAGRRSQALVVVTVCLVPAFFLSGCSEAKGEHDSSLQHREEGGDQSSTGGAVTCPNAMGALCATAKCFLYGSPSMAYCKCQLVNASFKSSYWQEAEFNYESQTGAKAFPEEGNICSFNAAGPAAGFVVSAFTVPVQTLTTYDGQDPLAWYRCPGGVAAQCDGGLCQLSTRGSTWPFLGTLTQDEVICSCPLTIAPTTSDFTFVGPASCNTSYKEQFCKQGGKSLAQMQTGTILPVGGPPWDVFVPNAKAAGMRTAGGTCAAPGIGESP
eukprot:TRINITY_DN36661_c0_g1_i1.p1 TRINITY_DN36661_c0_g1~~TRINITY_DN36661_c0_g1_i1.p1  ORF type:complete len:284 (+),score=31.99 TRINITY_DN36661_c0_g1_i1:48-854(+)